MKKAVARKAVPVLVIVKCLRMWVQTLPACWKTLLASCGMGDRLKAGVVKASKFQQNLVEEVHLAKLKAVEAVVERKVRLLVQKK